ncbi:hypothetical protein D3C72_1989550 [compost metagenome]
MILRLLVETPDHSEINQRDFAFTGNHHISGMGIGMKEAVDKDLIQHHLHKLLGYSF